MAADATVVGAELGDVALVESLPSLIVVSSKWLLQIRTS